MGRKGSSTSKQVLCSETDACRKRACISKDARAKPMRSPSPSQERWARGTYLSFGLAKYVVSQNRMSASETALFQENEHSDNFSRSYEIDVETKRLYAEERAQSRCHQRGNRRYYIALSLARSASRIARALMRTPTVFMRRELKFFEVPFLLPCQYRSEMTG